MDYKQTVKEIGDRFDKTGTLSLSDKQSIERLYYLTFGKYFTRTHCGDCYKDALIMIRLHLKKGGKQMAKSSEFVLKRGVVLATPGVASVLSGRDVPADLVVAHLAKFPNKISYFEEYPDNWMKLVEDFKNPKVQKTEAKTGKVDTDDEANGGDELSPEAAELVTLISFDLKAGMLKKDIKEKYKEYKVDGDALSVRGLANLIKLAEKAE